MSDIVKTEKPSVPVPPEPAGKQEADTNIQESASVTGLKSTEGQIEEDTRPVATLAAINEARKSMVSESKEEDTFISDDTPPPPEDAGIFSVINKTKTSGSKEEYV
jgi:hypothetical protein